MADRYVDPSVGASGAGTSWATAYKTLKEATDAAAAGELIYMHNGTADTVSTNTTWTLAAGVRVISTSDKTNNPPLTYATGATIDGSGGDYSFYFNGQFEFNGLTIKNGSTNSASYIIFGSIDNHEAQLNGCTLEFTGGSLSGSSVSMGYTTAANIKTRFTGCTFKFNSVNNFLRLRTDSVFHGCDFTAGTAQPATLFQFVNYSAGSTLVVEGCNCSGSATLVANNPVVPVYCRFSRCRLYSGGTIFAPTTVSAGEVSLFDCNSGDVHVGFAHYNYRGSTVISTSKYANDNICDADLSWQVAGNNNTKPATPYVSPWIDVYNDTLSAMTPYLECLRDGSASAFTEAEVWCEVSVKDQSGYSLASLYTNRTAPLATPAANETSSKTGADWTGEGGTAWFGKLQPNATVTPAEVGHIRMRVGVAGNHTVYVDPQIRGIA